MGPFSILDMNYTNSGWVYGWGYLEHWGIIGKFIFWYVRGRS